MRRLFLLISVWLAGAAIATSAFAHAALIRTDPPDGAVLKAAPTQVVLTFNEPVTPVELKLTDRSGKTRSLSEIHRVGDALAVSLRERMADGTAVLSWRVVSADGHPIGGALVFSIGHVTGAENPGVAGTDRATAIMLWSVRALFLGGLLFGAGGLFFAAFMVPAAGRARLMRPVGVAALVGLAAGAVSVGVQGADVLGRPLSTMLGAEAWAAGATTSYGISAAIGGIALVLALAGLLSLPERVRRGLAAAALLGVGLALASSGHASDAPPRQLTWAAVLLHGISAAFWAGALPSLAILLLRKDRAAPSALKAFSAVIPFAIIPLIGAGLLLSFVQLRSLSDLWQTDYGWILSGKLAAVLALLALAAFNRVSLTRPALVRDPRATRILAGTVVAEIGLMVVVVLLVAGWRLTPPPRSIVPPAAASAPIYVMPASPDGATMANVNITIRSGLAEMVIEVTDAAMVPVPAKEVEVSIESETLGIGPITRKARADGGLWRVDRLPVPAAGRWELRIGVLKSEFEQAELGAAVEMGP